MGRASDQILSVEQMRAAEEALIAAGSSVDELMQLAGRGAAEWVWRVAARHPVTVLCGPGNNGGDGYVIAERIRELGGNVVVVAGTEPATEAARTARALYQGEVIGPDAARHGDVFVDCLFGSGLSRPLSADHGRLLSELAASHRYRIAVDLPSGIDADNGLPLGDNLPRYEMTLALGAWKFAHFLMPASAAMGALRLVPIGVDAVGGAAEAVTRPRLAAPAPDSHKYRRGLLAVVGGAMPGAALLAAHAAQGAGAGYIKLFSQNAAQVSPDIVVEDGILADGLADDRNRAVLVGPGLGRDATAGKRLATALAAPAPVVLDGDALVLLDSRAVAERSAPVIATPHDGELLALERAFGLEGTGSRIARVEALARRSRMVIVAKGPDTVIADVDGRIACAPRATSWLSTAGTGDVLSGVVASRLAVGVDPFSAACEGVWLHGEAARRCSPPFTAGELAAAVPAAFAACL